MKTTIVIETPEKTDHPAGEIAQDYAELIRQSASDDGVPVVVTTEVIESEVPQPYVCTVLVRMPADDGHNTRPEDVTALLDEHDVDVISWHYEDLIGEEA
jgi:hypothetical protein